MNDSRDELDPGRRALLRSLLVQDARDDLAGAGAAASKRRVLSLSLAIGLVAAVAVGAVSIGVAGLPISSGPAATSTETPRPTPTRTPVPSPSPTPSATPTPTPTGTPAAGAAPSVAEFQAAVVAAGLDCSSWVPESSGTPGAVEVGTCQSSGLWYSVFATEADAAQVLALNDASLERGAFLSGPTWIAGINDVTGMRDDLVALQAVFGGTLNWDPGAQVDTIAGYETHLLWNLCVAEGMKSFPGAVTEDYRADTAHLTPDGKPEVYVFFETPETPMPTGTVWICQFGGEPSSPTLDYFNTKDI